jgi:hypothetical protein
MNQYTKGFGGSEPECTEAGRLEDYLHRRQAELMQSGMNAADAWNHAIEDAAVTDELEEGL